jgi:two-component system, NtrC family, nitrogen regulation sensor histidine kinase NtrY
MRTKIFLFLSVAFILLAIFFVSLSGKIKDEKQLVKRVQKTFINKLSVAEQVFHDFQLNDGKNAIIGVNTLNKNGVSLFIYDHDSLIFWSDNNVPIDQVNIDTLQNNSVVSILYNTYYCLIDTVDKGLGLCMVHLSSNYPYQNRFLINGTNPDFHLPTGTRILSVANQNTFSVINEQGQIAFYIDFAHADSNNSLTFRIIASLLLLLGLCLLMNYFRILLKQAPKGKKAQLLILVMSLLVITRILLMLTGVLSNRFIWFDPYIYATWLAPTFGDLILNTLFFLFFAYLINRFVQLPERFLKYSFNRNAWIGILNTLFILSLVYVYSSSSSLITHSSLNIVVHNISQLRIPVVVAYIIFALNYLAVFLIALWIFKTLTKEKPYKLIINSGVFLACTLLASYLFKNPIDLYSIFFAFFLYIFSGYMHSKLKPNALLSTLVLVLLFFAVYIMLFTIKLSTKKELLRNKSLIISLSTEHDPIAEYLFEDLSKNIENDSSITNMLKSNSFDIMHLYEYLSKNYFSGYWKKYDSQITVCRAQDSVLVNGNVLYWYPCYDFFTEIIDNGGLKIPNSKFYYINKFTGLINYLGWLQFKVDNYTTISLFVELDSKLTPKPLGYPELLLDEGLHGQNEALDYSHAKYYKGQLISHSGKYEYSLISDVFEDSKINQFNQIKRNNFNHLVFRTNEENIVVVSEPEIRFIDYIVLFSYVFVFYYLLSLAIIFLFVRQYRNINFRDSLRNKIQFSVISILITSLLLIAGSTTWFNIRKYNQTQYRILEEKINSVYVELEHKLAFEEKLEPQWSEDKYDNIGQLLVKFSDVFYSDINLYDPSGNLLATSRNKVFQLGLQSKKMEPQAFYKMNKERLARFVHRETINNLSYLSAYVPFVNNQGKLLAYLNLPYFTKQKELQEDITTLTVAIINIYVLLILLTIIIAVIISDQITKPLEMIQDRLRGLTLGGKHEPIAYSKNDEIGRLVNGYNKMVLELESNIELLAKSERESAWREMAKQVAHEIKNPLTPMRLSVQQLKRSWDDKKEDFDKYLNRVTETLIEQIDNLSAIAGEFSNFAKMPMANIHKVNVNEVINTTFTLFNANEQAQIKLNTVNEAVWVMADPDQLGRVFINIVKNGIQAIPEGKKGKIDIRLSVEGPNALIEIKDNGKGIPDEIKHKLFTPNFTTKSGGMGLGLAIVNNILKSVDGTIRFTTELNKGSIFTVVLPLVKN